jgi:hypothetical protein
MPTTRDPLEKIAGLLAAYVTRDMNPEEAALMLDSIGFTNREITGILDVGESYVRQVRFQRKNKGKKKKAKAS